jgi:hypothetical protein
MKNLPLTLTTKKVKRSRLNIIKSSKLKVKEMRQKEKKDLLKVEIELEKTKRVQNSPARQNSMQGISFNTTSETISG